jgi:hypothetical protein
MNRRVFGIFAKSSTPYRFRRVEGAQFGHSTRLTGVARSCPSTGAHLNIGKVKAMERKWTL